MKAKLLPDEIWDIDDLAAYLKVSRRFVYRLTSQRRIGHHKAGGGLRFTSDNIAAYLESTAVHPAALFQRRKRRPRAEDPS